MSDIYEYKWSNGIPYDKSKKLQRPVENALNETQQLTHNKRELSNDKLSERMMFSQINQNPFLANHNYIEDINVQETFLRPKNSNFSSDNFNR
jgi:hypothetical protein